MTDALTIVSARIDRAASERPTPEAIEAAVVQLTARLLGRTEADVRADPGRYAAFHWDDGFVEEGGVDEIDWVTLALPAEEEPSGIYGRRDFDLRRSRFLSDAFRAQATTDRSLRELLVHQDEYLYGEQLATLIAEKRVRADDLDIWQVEGRLCCGEHLVEVMTALWMLGDFDGHSLEPGEFGETHPEWEGWLAGIEPPSLRAHLSVFFQTPSAARCTGALFERADPDDDEVLARWWIGEGQGCCTLTRLGEPIPPVPPFTGHALIRRPPPTPGSRPLASGRTDEVLATPLHQLLADLDPELFELPSTDAELRRALASEVKRDPHLFAWMSKVGELIEGGEARAALALAAACAARVDPEHAVSVEYHRCWASYTLGCWEEALAHAERTLALWRRGTPIPESFVHNNLAWCALHTGQLDRALAHADKALALDPDNDRALGTRADVLFARGEERAALKLFEKLMRAGVDPEATAAACAHPGYRKLALKYRMPVELTDAEAVELGV